MLIVFIVNLAVIGLAVTIHYEFLHRITLLLPNMRIRYRFRIVLGVFLALTAHAVEVWIFAYSFYLMHHAPGWGELVGNFDGTFMDCVYFYHKSNHHIVIAGSDYSISFWRFEPSKRVIQWASQISCE